MVQTCTVAGGVGAKWQKVSSSFALFSKSDKYSTTVSLCKPQTTKKRRKLLIYVFHLSALFSRFTSFRFQSHCSQTFALQLVGYYCVSVFTVRQCCWMQTWSCTDQRGVQNTAEYKMTTRKKMVFIVTGHLEHYGSPGAESSNSGAVV